MLEEKTGARVKQQYVSSVSGDVVPRKEMIKGYEFAKGQYVTFTNEELKTFDVEANKQVEIKEFVPISEVDPIYFDSAYYVGPDKGADRPYALLREAMKKTGRAAVAKYAVRGKQYLVLVRPKDDGLVMQQLRYAHEIRALKDVPLGEGEVSDEELKLAVQLVEQIASEEFHPENYEDEVRRRVEEAIQAKVEGQEITAEPSEEPKAKIIDLMDALKASLGKPEKKPAKKKAPKKAAKKSRKAAEG
jgi:DNA end-binding protein Ku